MAVRKYCHRCQAVVERGHKHKPPDRRPSAAERGYDERWRRTRARFLAEHPVCGWEEGCIAPANEVHHRDGKGPLGELGYEPSNLQALCGHHHKVLTARLQPGGWNHPDYRRTYDET